VINFQYRHVPGPKKRSPSFSDGPVWSIRLRPPVGGTTVKVHQQKTDLGYHRSSSRSRPHGLTPAKDFQRARPRPNQIYTKHPRGESPRRRPATPRHGTFCTTITNGGYFFSSHPTEFTGTLQGGPNPYTVISERPTNEIPLDFRSPPHHRRGPHQSINIIKRRIYSLRLLGGLPITFQKKPLLHRRPWHGFGAVTYDEIKPSYLNHNYYNARRLSFNQHKSAGLFTGNQGGSIPQQARPDGNFLSAHSRSRSTESAHQEQPGGKLNIPPAIPLWAANGHVMTKPPQ